MLCYETVLDPEGVDVLVPPRSARGLQPHEIAIVITRHLYPSHHLVPLREKVKDLYSEVGEPPPKPFEGSLNLPRPEGDALLGPLLQVESRLGVVTTLRMVNFIEKLVVLVIQRLKVRSHQLLVGFRLLHGLPPSSDERRVAQLLANNTVWKDLGLVQDCLDQIRDIRASEAWAEGRISDLSKEEWESRRYREEQAELKSQIASMNASLNGGTSFGDAVFRAGFSLKAQPTVTIPVASALTKAPTFPAVGDWNRLAPVTVPMGTDRRWLFPNLVSQSVGPESAVQDFRQTVRTLTGSVQRNLDAVTDKANVDQTLTLVTESLSQFAVTVNEIPNAVLESISTAQDWLNSEMRFQVEKALDAHVFSQIVAASPPFGNTGADTITKVRNAIGSMRDEGANPDLLIMNSTDAAALDLSTSGTSTPYLFAVREPGGASPLFGLRLIERTSAAGNEPPYVLDSNMLGRLYLGSMRIDADPFSDFRKNLTTPALRGQSSVPRPQRQGRSPDRGDMSEFKVLKEPVSYNHRIYQPGETLEARKDEDMEGFLQAGYVAAESKSKRRSKK